MIAPGSTLDWITGVGILGALTAFAAAAHRWMPAEADPVEPAAPRRELRELQVEEHVARSASESSR